MPRALGHGAFACLSNHRRRCRGRDVVPNWDTPRTESVARELVPLKNDPEEMRETWVEAVEASNGQPTAAEVRERVDIRRNRVDKRGSRATHHEPGWFEQLGCVGEALGEVERRLDRLGAAITRKPNAKFTAQVEDVAERAATVAARLRELGEQKDRRGKGQRDYERVRDEIRRDGAE